MERQQRKLAAIVSVDVVGYSKLMQADETGTHARLKAQFEELIVPRIEEYGGRVVKLMGDGVLAEFPSVVSAAEWAVRVQTEVAAASAKVRPDQRIEYRIGVNLGDVIVDGDDLYGDGVNVAARLQEIAEPNGVCLSDAAFQQVLSKVEAVFVGGEEVTLKNITMPVRAWRWSTATQNRSAAPAAAPPPPLHDKPSIAVLPLDNMSNSKECEYFADGITEDVITLLARIPSFFVIARNSSFSYKGKQTDIRQVGRELGVRYVVEGSLRPIGNRARVTIQLIEAESGRHLWAERFDRATADLFEIQDEIATAIVARLAPELTRAEIDRIQRRPPADLDAWDYYQQASGILSLKGWHESTFAEGAELYRKAIALDPKFAPARAGLSLLLAIGHMVGHVTESDEALSEIDAALDLDSDSSEVLGFAGCALSDLGHTTRGIELLERAIERDPSNAQAWVALGASLLTNRQPELAIEKLEYGLRISPRDNRMAVFGSIYALALGYVGRLDEAIEQARIACRGDAKLHNPRVVLAVLQLTSNHTAEAIATLAEARRIRPNLSLREVRGIVGARYAKALETIWNR